MPEITQGAVTAEVPDHITIPDDAGKLNLKQMQRLPKARRGVGMVSAQTAQALRNTSDRVALTGTTADEIEQSGKAAEDIDRLVVDAEYVAMTLRQANLLLDAAAHTKLRRALAAVRAAEKFDPKVTELFGPLIEYFASASARDGEEPTE